MSNPLVRKVTPRLSYISNSTPSVSVHDLWSSSMKWLTFITVDLSYTILTWQTSQRVFHLRLLPSSQGGWRIVIWLHENRNSLLPDHRPLAAPTAHWELTHWVHRAGDGVWDRRQGAGITQQGEPRSTERHLDVVNEQFIAISCKSDFLTYPAYDPTLVTKKKSCRPQFAWGSKAGNWSIWPEVSYSVRPSYRPLYCFHKKCRKQNDKVKIKFSLFRKLIRYCPGRYRNMQNDKRRSHTKHVGTRLYRIDMDMYTFNI